MNFNFKTYKFLNLKKKIKKKSIIYICNTKNKSSFIKEMQHNKNLNCYFYKINNSIIKKCLEKSIFSNFSNIISSNTLIIELKKIKKLKEIKRNNIIIGLNLNNKIYIYDNKIMKLILLNFKNDQKNLLKTFKTNLKILKKLRNNVI